MPVFAHGLNEDVGRLKASFHYSKEYCPSGTCKCAVSGDAGMGAGVELRLDMNSGYRFKVPPALGLARGFGPDGGTAVYFYIHALPGVGRGK